MISWCLGIICGVGLVKDFMKHSYDSMVTTLLRQAILRELLWVLKSSVLLCFFTPFSCY